MSAWVFHNILSTVSLRYRTSSRGEYHRERRIIAKEDWRTEVWTMRMWYVCFILVHFCSPQMLFFCKVRFYRLCTVNCGFNIRVLLTLNLRKIPQSKESLYLMDNSLFRKWLPGFSVNFVDKCRVLFIVFHGDRFINSGRRKYIAYFSHKLL